MEAAGIALGTMPLLISIVEDFGGAVSFLDRIRNYRSESVRLVRLLNAEHVRFRCTCEKLLQSVVPESEMRAFMKDPGRETWESIVSLQAGSFETKLDTMFRPYIELFNQMAEAVERLRKRLGVGPDGKVSEDCEAIPKRDLELFTMLIKSQTITSLKALF